MIPKSDKLRVLLTTCDSYSKVHDALLKAPGHVLREVMIRSERDILKSLTPAAFTALMQFEIVDRLLNHGLSMSIMGRENFRRSLIQATLSVDRKDLFDIGLNYDWGKNDPSAAYSLIISVVESKMNADKKTAIVRSICQVLEQPPEKIDEILLCAVRKSLPDVVDFMVLLGADISIDSEKPLRNAAYSGNAGMVSHLVLKHGANAARVIEACRFVGDDKSADFIQQYLPAEAVKWPTRQEIITRLRELEETVRELTEQVRELQGPVRTIVKMPVPEPKP